MGSVEVGSGVCLGFGATNARKAVCSGGDISGFTSVETPSQPRLFFGWMARQLLDASHAGQGWLVSGFPGPVSPNGTLVGPLPNVGGMSKQQYNLRKELVAADPEVGRVLDQGFVLLAENDANLAAQAAAILIAEHIYRKTGSIVVGTGLGAGVVEKDPNYDDVHHADNKNPFELGHLLRSGDPLDRFEDSFSGPALAARYKVDDAKDLPHSHPAWQGVGVTIGRLATTLGLMNGVELVVPCGGVASGAAEKYKPHLDRFMETYREYGNGPQKLFMPEVAMVPPKYRQTFEMHGAEGVMRDHLTRYALTLTP